MGEGTGVYRVLVGKPDGKRPQERPRRRWEDNIKIDLHVVGCGGIDWIEMARDRDRWQALVNAVMNTFCRSAFGKSLCTYSVSVRVHSAVYIDNTGKYIYVQ
jgi:hypothetical protein